jgi:hypothetical protein
MLTKTLGSLVGTPLMTVLWVQAIKLGGVGLGLPYSISAVSKGHSFHAIHTDVFKCTYLIAAFVIARLRT